MISSYSAEKLVNPLQGYPRPTSRTKNLKYESWSLYWPNATQQHSQKWWKNLGKDDKLGWGVDANFLKRRDMDDQASLMCDGPYSSLSPASTCVYAPTTPSPDGCSCLTGLLTFSLPPAPMSLSWPPMSTTENCTSVGHGNEILRPWELPDLRYLIS